ncbi:MAG: ATP-binding protein [Actinomycetota bacterium]|nr:ATP-binding protein [Actinomycetota bacterium]
MEEAVNKFLERVLSEKEDAKKESLAREAAPSCAEEKGASSFRGFARIAIYDSLSSPPQIIELSCQDRQEFIDSLGAKIYQLSHEGGGNAPFAAIKELVENLIHASFKEVVVTILNKGNTIRIADQGPGIANKDKALEPGFSTATSEMKHIIKGVGSGLPIVKEIVGLSGGVMKIEDNLVSGSVITMEFKKIPELGGVELPAKKKPSPLTMTLSNRQKKVLFLVAEVGPIGPSEMASELSMSLSTAYRDLRSLEDLGLLRADDRGRRVLSQEGVDFMENFFDQTG